MRGKFQALLAEYGRVALASYFALFFLTLAGFVLAIQLGFQPRGATGTAGVLGAAYVATKLTQPLRILATLALTPLVATALKKLQRR